MIHLTDWLTTPQVPLASKITGTMDRHLHDHAFFEIFYLLDGSIEHELNGEKTLLRAGDIYFLNPEDAHIFLRVQDDTAKHRDIIVRKNFFRTACNYISPDLYTDYTENKIKKRFHLSPSKLNEFESVFKNFSTLSATRPHLATASAKATLAQLLGLLVSHQIEEQLHYPEWFQELLEQFNNPAKLSEGLDGILSTCFYSKEHICRVFKKLMGVTMTDYLNSKRLEQAANLLIYTRQQVTKISNDLGFSSVSYFNKIFKEKYGCSPTHFNDKINE